MDNPTTTQYANLMHNFILKARSTVREIDPQNDLTFLRIRSKKNEIMVAPENRDDTPTFLLAPCGTMKIRKEDPLQGIAAGGRSSAFPAATLQKPP
ncbi:Dynein light chain roadblock-type 1 [Vulpes lagopus]|nr:dynein light chain roadblock-type 1 isoform X3 [Vulpes lagopus]